MATERFDPTDGKKWENYVAWAKIPALKELVSLDSLLCERILRAASFEVEDWQHIVHENCRLEYFLDLHYLIARTKNVARKNILGVYRNPNTHIETPPAAGGFVFIGYDLLEEFTQISALTNCGGFPDSFSNAELNSCGLLFSFERAREVQRSLTELNPEEPHAHCEMYAIWRLGESFETA